MSGPECTLVNNLWVSIYQSLLLFRGFTDASCQHWQINGEQHHWDPFLWFYRFPPRCFLTVSKISASLSRRKSISNQVILSWFKFEFLEGHAALWFQFCKMQSVNHGLLKHAILQDGSEQRYGSISISNGRFMFLTCLRQLPSLNPFKKWSIILQNNRKVFTTTSQNQLFRKIWKILMDYMGSNVLKAKWRYVRLVIKEN